MGSVQPAELERAAACPNCGVYRDGLFSQRAVDAPNEEIERGVDSLTRDYKRMVRANMAEEIKGFVAALDANGILPEDF